MTLLVLSVLALLVGPAAMAAAGKRPGALAALDGFVVVALVGLMVVHVLPFSLAVGGGWAALAAAGGLVLPAFVERELAERRHALDGGLLWLGVAGLALHAMLDGTALVSDHDHGELLAVGVLLHRVPVGMSIWWVVRPLRGTGAAIVVTAVIAGSTAVGAFGAHDLVDALPLPLIGVFQALVAGSLLHVVVGHRVAGVHAASRLRPRYATLGALMALLSLWQVGETHAAHGGQVGELSAGRTFVTLALQIAPAILLGFVAVGLLQAALPAATPRRLAAGGLLRRAASGLLFGLSLPLGTGHLPSVYRRLMGGGTPAVAALALLVATPLLGLDAIFASVPLLGAELTVLRVAGALAVTMGVALGVGSRLDSAPQAAPAEAPTRHATAGERLAAGLRFGLGTLVDHVGPWILMGLLVASLVEPFVAIGWLSGVPAGAEVALLAVLGLPAYVSAAGATPLVAVLMHKGLSAGAGIAFLLTGSAMSLATFGALSALHGRRVAAAVAAVTAGLAAAVGLVVNVALGPQAPPALHDLAEQPPSPFAWVCLVLCAALLLASLLRQGPRGLLDQLFDPGGAREREPHGHGPPGPDGEPCGPTGSVGDRV